MKILVVEDQVDVAVSLARILESAGHRCEVAFNAHEAVDTIDSQSPELVITDFGLPDGDGFEVTSHVKETLPETPLVLVTGYDIEGIEKASRKAGIAAYLRKPFTITALMGAIDTALKGRSVPPTAV